MKKILTAIEEQKFTAREMALFSIVLFLLGLVLGIIFSPKGNRMVGCHNGNNNTGTFNEDNDDKECNNKD